MKTILLILSFVVGFVIRQQDWNPAASQMSAAVSGGKHKATARPADGRTAAQDPWKPDASVEIIWQAITPHAGGDPALSVRAVMEGILTRKDLDPEMAAEILHFALSEDPDGVTAYLLQALEEGRLEILRTKLPLPPIHHPALPKLLAGYAKAFGAGWEASDKPLPFALRRLRYLPPVVFQNCISGMTEAGPDSFRLAATLYPREVAADPATVGPALALLKKPEARLAFLTAAFAAPGAQPAALAASCRSPGEWLLADLLSNSALPTTRPRGPDINEAEMQNLLGMLRPSETLYRKAMSLGEAPTGARMKTEIIRQLAETNLIAATRALSTDPYPPDEAIALAVAAMGDDPASAQAWIARIRDPEIKARFPTPASGTGTPAP